MTLQNVTDTYQQEVPPHAPAGAALPVAASSTPRGRNGNSLAVQSASSESAPALLGRVVPIVRIVDPLLVPHWVHGHCVVSPVEPLVLDTHDARGLCSVLHYWLFSPA